MEEAFVMPPAPTVRDEPPRVKAPAPETKVRLSMLQTLLILGESTAMPPNSIMAVPSLAGTTLPDQFRDVDQLLPRPRPTQVNVAAGAEEDAAAKAATSETRPRKGARRRERWDMARETEVETGSAEDEYRGTCRNFVASSRPE